MKKNLLLFVLSFSVHSLFAELAAISLTDVTKELGKRSEDSMFFAFAEGDVIVFSCLEKDSKELSLIEVIEYPTNNVFSCINTTAVNGKRITVSHKGIYKFHMVNDSRKRKIVHVMISRIPSGTDKQTFNSTVQWANANDTVFKFVTEKITDGYDTTWTTVTEIQPDTIIRREEMLFDKVERVHSRTNMDHLNKTWLAIPLPSNTRTRLRTETVIGWAYWIGVGNEAQASWTKNMKTVGNLTGKAVGMFVSPLAGLVVGAVTSLATPNLGEDIEYYFVEGGTNVDEFMAGRTFYQFDQGKGIAAFGKNLSRTQGTYYVCLENDNYTLGVDVTVKVSAVVEEKRFKEVQVRKSTITPIKGTRTRKVIDKVVQVQKPVMSN